MDFIHKFKTCFLLVTQMNTLLHSLIQTSQEKGHLTILNMQETIHHLSLETGIHAKVMERFVFFLSNRMAYRPSPFYDPDGNFQWEGFSEDIDEESTQRGFLVPLRVYVSPFVWNGCRVMKMSLSFRPQSPEQIGLSQHFQLRPFEEEVDDPTLTVDGYLVLI